MTNGLILFAREPLPGSVKTRLAAAIGDHAAAELYDAMLREVLRSCRELVDISTVVYWACDDSSLQRLAETYDCCSRRQSPGDLGERMRYAFEEMFAAGNNACCIIGSDAPDLPQDHIHEAFRLLRSGTVDAVFGPCSDGGYYLLGLRRTVPALFDAIPWGSDRVLAESVAAARARGLTVALLPEWHDIDTAEDLDAYRMRCRSREEGRMP